MPLDVLVTTPSGPFGELIRLTLEADPEFRCTLLDNSGELRSTLQESTFQALIFDCSFLQPDPTQVSALLKDEFPGIALLLIPSDHRMDSTAIRSIPAAGYVSRPFDSSILQATVRAAIQKKRTPVAVDPSPEPIIRKDTSWWNAFQVGILETAATGGLIIQNGLVIASTPGISAALQQQVTASVLRFWNPDESSDLMRYVKDLVTGQEWMMYASKVEDGSVLALLFQPQTPVTKVRSQTLNMAKEISTLMVKPAVQEKTSEVRFFESPEPPKLHEILGQKLEPEAPRVIKNSFPVEWFREADLPEFNQSSEKGNPEQEANTSDQVPYTPADETEKFEQTNSGKTPVGISADEPDAEKSNKLTEEPEPVESSSAYDRLEQSPVETINSNVPISPVEIQEKPLTSTVESEKEHFPSVDLTVEPYVDNGLDSMQPIPLGRKKENLTSSVNTSTEKKLDNPADQHPPVEITQPLVRQIREEPNESIPVDKEINPEVSADSGLDQEPELSSSGDMEEKKAVAPMEEEILDRYLSYVDTAQEKVEIDSEPIPETQSQMAPLDKEQAPVNETIHTGFTEPVITPFAAEDTKEDASVESSESSVAGVSPLQASLQPPDDNLLLKMNHLEEPDHEVETETYTVAMVPRLESTILHRQLAGILNQTMSRLCLAFNWKLDNLTIRPTYMQWMVTIPVSIAPEDMVNIVKKETTQEIKKSGFVESATEEEFWASESMSAPGKDFIPSIHWQNFILRRKTHEIA